MKAAIAATGRNGQLSNQAVLPSFKTKKGYSNRMPFFCFMEGVVIQKLTVVVKGSGLLSEKYHFFHFYKTSRANQRIAYLKFIEINSTIAKVCIAPMSLCDSN